jgi:transposase-like protein
MTEHLGYEKHDNGGGRSGDSRNGYSEKTVLTENQEAVIQVPRDRNGTFEPELVPKYQKRVPLFNDQIISMYSFGMTNRDIKSHLEALRCFKWVSQQPPPEAVAWGGGPYKGP